MTSDKVLIEKQRLETPAYTWRWHEELYPGGVTYCMHPAAYANDEYGLNADGDPWMWYFCVTDDFGNLQPQPNDAYWGNDQNDENLSFYWGGKPGKELPKINFGWFQLHGHGSPVVHWDSGVVGVIDGSYNPSDIIHFDVEDLNPDYPEQPQLEIRWDNGTTQKLTYPSQCQGIFALI